MAKLIGRFQVGFAIEDENGTVLVHEVDHGPEMCYTVSVVAGVLPNGDVQKRFSNRKKAFECAIEAARELSDDPDAF